MAKFKITGPDGASYEITAPDGASEQDVLSYAQQNFGGGHNAAPAAPALPKVDAPTSGMAMGLRDPIDAGAQLLRRVVPEGVGRAVDNVGNWLADKGLPVARSTGVQGVDNIVQGVNQSYDEQRRAAQPPTLNGLITGERQDPGFDWARLGGNMVNPVNYVGGGALKGATTAAQLARGGAMAGGISALFQPVVDTTDGFWGQKAGQAAMGAAAGGVLTPAVAKVGQGLAKGARALTTPTPRGNVFTPDGVNIRVNNILQSQGLNLQDAPEVILQSVRRQVEEAGRTGGRLDPAAMLRRAQFEAVGLADDAAPTLGQMTRDPMQFANEKNLSGVQLNRGARGMGNDLADRFQLQNQRLGEVFDHMGAREATDRVTAGQSFMDALREADAPVRAGVDDLYNTARGMNAGRAADLERATFSTNANNALDEGMFGAFLPSDVRNLLNQISEGKTPFNVDAAVQIDTLLSQAQRRADRAGDAAAARAVGVVRDALHGTPLAAAPAQAAAGGMADDLGRAAGEVVDEGVTDVVPRMAPQLPRPPGTALATDIEFPQMPTPGTAMGPAMAPPIDEGAAARAAFDQARRAARDRFATIEATPALKAALDNDAPDQFVRNFILNADVRDVEAMRNVLQNSPDALSQARAQVADHLKRAAFGENVSGDKGFTSERYLNTVRAIGPQKLQVFFSPAEIVRLNLAGKVASDINSIPVGAKYGTNSSGTGAAVMNLLSQLGSRTVGRIPGVGPVAGLIADKTGAMRTERAIGQALSPAAAEPARELSPEVLRALQLLYPAGGVAGGVLGGAAIN
ncbi:hypothetical protein [Hydrogenophaga sp. 2FB]|uniref:hypothetical protein n=1 Tax=Hydrogenophaga sp. 2FB TaxID=2502187 RepID=UPI0010F5742D|nr:hypothetical protein [Hydrogenophaga sp. 2FB]